MDALLSAVASDLIGRLVAFLVGKYQKCSTVDTALRLLLRARVVVEEAEGRQITNRAMLQQLNNLRRELCRVAYALDTLRWRERRPPQAAARRPRPHVAPLPSSYYTDVPSVMVESLEAALSDTRELVVLLGACPRVARQPYSTYLFMESCMFGRHLEKEQIISFLLSQPSHHQDVDALPVIGPHEVGKRTLVEHACLDDRVRDNKHRWSVFDLTARLLVVIDVVSDDAGTEESWRRFRSSFRRRAHGGSKAIFISRTEAHAALGTVPALRLHAPRREELWYFFKTLAFGAADPGERPDLARISDVAVFAAANVVAARWRPERALLAPRAGYVRRGEGAAARRRRRRVRWRQGRVLLPLPAGDGRRRARCSPLLLQQAQGDRRRGAARRGVPPSLRGDAVRDAGVAVAACDVERARQLVAGEKRARKRWRDQHEPHRRILCVCTYNDMERVLLHEVAIEHDNSSNQREGSIYRTWHQ
jgi:hypothetical protein